MRMATARVATPNQDGNYSRISRAILDLGGNILRDALYHNIKPTYIECSVQNSRYFRKYPLNSDQMLILQNASIKGDYSEFDVTLIYTLLRNLKLTTNVPRPTNGWGTLPVAAGHKTLGDDIERIRMLRNLHGHASTTNVTDVEYERCISELKDICSRMDIDHSALLESPAPHKTYTQTLIDITEIITEDSVEEIQQFLRYHYEHLSKVPITPSIRGQHRLECDDIFVPVEMIQNLKCKQHTPTNKRKTENKPIENFKDLLMINDTTFTKRVYLYGNAGAGKTTLCIKIASDWRNSKSAEDGKNVLSKFDFVFCIEFKRLKKIYSSGENVTIIDLICKDYLFDQCPQTEKIPHILKSERYRSLILLDGFDEWKHDEVPTSLDLSSKCLVFITSRQSKLSNLGNIYCEDDIVVEILGIKDVSSTQIVKNILENYSELKKSSKDYEKTVKSYEGLIQNSNIKSLAKIPTVSIMITVLLQAGKLPDDSITSIFICMIKLIKREAIASRLVKRKGNDFIRAVWELGKNGFELLKYGQSFIEFSDDENTPHYWIWKFGIKMDLVSEPFVPITDASSDYSGTSHYALEFCNTYFQEFLAALYIAFEGINAKCFRFLLDQCVSMDKIELFSNLFIFLSGLRVDLGIAVQNRMYNYSTTEDLCELRNTWPSFDEPLDKLFTLSKIQWLCFQDLKNAKSKQEFSTLAKTSYDSSLDGARCQLADICLRDRTKEPERSNQEQKVKTEEPDRSNQEQKVKELLRTGYTDLLSISAIDVDVDTRTNLTKIINNSKELQLLYLKFGLRKKFDETEWPTKMSCLILIGLTLSEKSFDELFEVISSSNSLRTIHIEKIECECENIKHLDDKKKIINVKNEKIAELGFLDVDICGLPLKIDLKFDKNIKLKKFTLSGISLTESGLSELFKSAIDENTFLIGLNLSSLKFSIKPLDMTLNAGNILTTLELKDISITTGMAECLKIALQGNSELYKLILNNIACEGTELDFVLSNKIALTDLQLCRIRITSKTADDICKTLKDNSILEVLSLSKLRCKAKTFMYDIVVSNKNKIKTLMLAFITVTPVTLQDLTKALKQQATFEELFLSAVKCEDALDICVSNQTKLKRLRLTKVELTPETLSDFSKLHFHSQSDRTFSELHLSNITCSDRNKSIITLPEEIFIYLPEAKLQNIHVSANSVDKLEQKLKNNSKLEVLHLCDIKGFTKQSTVLSTLPLGNLIKLKLGYFKVKAMGQLATCISAISTLQELYLLDISCTDNVFQIRFSELRELKVLVLQKIKVSGPIDVTNNKRLRTLIIKDVTYGHNGTQADVHFGKSSDSDYLDFSSYLLTKVHLTNQSLSDVELRKFLESSYKLESLTLAKNKCENKLIELDTLPICTIKLVLTGVCICSSYTDKFSETETTQTLELSDIGDCELSINFSNKLDLENLYLGNLSLSSESFLGLYELIQKSVCLQNVRIKNVILDKNVSERIGNAMGFEFKKHTTKEGKVFLCFEKDDWTTIVPTNSEVQQSSVVGCKLCTII